MFYLLALLVAFIAIVMWAFSKKRRRRFEQDGRIPFEDEKNKGD
ncbi:MAG TPA: cbb3-type cytochrome c oxidase subunit 3 [Burkholderiales bacterium]|nr:cbb3-type cytochrome c oxidase subunit 3 [Burkholderiales bacterium]